LEILAENVDRGEFLLLLGFLGVVGAFFVIIFFAGVAMSISLKSFTSEDFFGLLIGAGISALCIFAFIAVYKSGPNITYEAKVTDFNEVYESGYEIVSKHGSLYTIRESEAK